MVKLNEASPCGDMMHLLRKYDVALLRVAMMCCLLLCADRHTSIRRSRHHWAKHCIICRRQTSLKKAIRGSEWLFSWHTLTKSIHTTSFLKSIHGFQSADRLIPWY